MLNVNGGLTKSPLKEGHGWVIAPGHSGDHEQKDYWIYNLVVYIIFEKHKNTFAI